MQAYGSRLLVGAQASTMLSAFRDCFSALDSFDIMPLVRLRSMELLAASKHLQCRILLGLPVERLLSRTWSVSQ